jgi:hypothetical protein
MSLPKFVVEILNKKFTPAEVELITKNWYTYSQMSLTNSFESEFLRQGQAILAITKTKG